MKSYPRQERVADLLHQQIARLMRKECRGEHLNENVSITEVRVSRGGFHCIVYLASFKGETYLRRALQEAESGLGRMQSYLGKRMRMKKLPVIQFRADELLARGERIGRLLREAGVEPSDNDQSTDESDQPLSNQTTGSD